MQHFYIHIISFGLFLHQLSKHISSIQWIVIMHFGVLKLQTYIIVKFLTWKYPFECWTPSKGQLISNANFEVFILTDLLITWLCYGVPFYGTQNSVDFCLKVTRFKGFYLFLFFGTERVTIQQNLELQVQFTMPKIVYFWFSIHLKNITLGKEVLLKNFHVDFLNPSIS